ncbi:MAG: YigZ family protein [Paramuribaculum sp.]|nr:YigZ family protein [Paramuribaculum sp.]
MAQACDFLTLGREGTAIFKEKMSKFIAFARHVASAEEARNAVAEITSRYHDARHVCWAYMLGPDRLEFLSSDNGEPSGTAGKPILGQINSAGLTDCVVIVVRYFGGIKLGTSGLIAAYREAARLAIAEAETVADCVRTDISFTFPYMSMNDVMKIAKGGDAEIVGQEFDNTCRMTLRARTDMAAALTSRLTSIDGVTLSET